MFSLVTLAAVFISFYHCLVCDELPLDEALSHIGPSITTNDVEPTFVQSVDISSTCPISVMFATIFSLISVLKFMKIYIEASNVYAYNS